MKIIKFFLSICVFLFCLSCGSNSEADVNVQTLEGTKWKLAGIVDTEKGSLKVLEPKDCKECYTFTFDTDSTASGRSLGNILLVRLKPFLFFNVATEILDCHDSDCALFYEAIKSIVCYKLEKNEFKFYFEDQKKYLLFKPY